jgi:hypothetical protein
VILGAIHGPFDEFHKDFVAGNTLRRQTNGGGCLGITAQLIALVNALAKTITEGLSLYIRAAFA